jgi:hypothetical protein
VLPLNRSVWGNRRTVTSAMVSMETTKVRGQIVGELGLAVAERPILRADLDEVYEDIIGPHAESAVEKLPDPRVQHLLLIGGTAASQSDLDENNVVRALHA